MLALSIAAQTYLSMLGHGHSFKRMLAWQLTTWAFWACAAPVVLRRGAEFMARRPRTLADVVPLVGLGTLLLSVHSVLSAQLTMWIQPFVPVETYTLVQAWAAQLPIRFAIDLFAYGLLIALGGALWTHRRAQAARSTRVASRDGARARATPRAQAGNRTALPLQHSECDYRARQAEGEQPRGGDAGRAG